MRDEKEERKKQARSNKQTRPSNTAHPNLTSHSTPDEQANHQHVHVNERCRRKKEASKVKQTTKQSNTAHPKKNELPRVGLKPTTHMYMFVYTKQLSNY